MIHPLDTSLERNQTTFENTSCLVCPVCGFEYCHFEKPKFKKCDDYSAWQGRGSLITIPCYCENGHTFEICLGFHKGNTSVFTQNHKTEEHPQCLKDVTRT